jgi:hypothetical protein
MGKIVKNSVILGIVARRVLYGKSNISKKEQPQ